MQNKWIGYAGWTLGAIGLGASLYLISVVSNLRADLSEKDSLTAQFESKLDSVVGENSQLSTTLDAMSRQLDSATAKINSLESEQIEMQEAALLVANEEVTDGLLDSLPESIGDLLDDEKLGGGLKDMMGGMAEMMNSPEMQEMTAKMQVNMQYAEYLALFADDPEKQALINSILMEHSMEQTANAFALMAEADGIDASLDQAMNATPLSELLAEVLTPQELAEFEIYEEEKPARMMRQSFDMQLSMMASGIPEESRAVIGDLVMEEWSYAQADSSNQSDVNAMTSQLEIYERALERSADYLSETDYSQFESFVDYQQTIMQQFDFLNQNDDNQ
jgi:hypothetical protein